MKRRIDGLERHNGKRARCPECGGAGRVVYTNDHPDNRDKPIEGCPACGKAFVIRFVSEGHEWCPPRRELPNLG